MKTPFRFSKCSFGRSPLRTSRPKVERLEDRIVLNGAIPERVADSLRILLINQDAADVEALSATANDGVLTVSYDPLSLGLTGLSELLRNLSLQNGGRSISQLGLATHGEAGRISLGANVIWANDTLADAADDLIALRSLLTPEARIDLLSCDVAATDAGRDLVDRLASLTGATVFASDNPVGTTEGADFTWEYVAGGPTSTRDLFDPTALEKAAPFHLLGDWAEGNDTFDQAVYLGAAGDYSWGGLSVHNSSDVDWFVVRIENVANSSHYVRIAFTHGQGDLDCELYGPNSTFLNSSKGTTDQEQISLAGLPAGDYYLKVYGYNGAANPSYSVSVHGPALVSSDFLETNDQPQFAFTMPNIDQGFTLNGANIANSSDVDWFYVTLDGTGTPADHFTIDSFNSSLADLDIYLYDLDQNLIDSSAGFGNSETISFDGLSAGHYYVKVIPYSISASMPYRIVCQGPVASTADRFEANNTPATAHPFGVLSGQRVEDGLSISSGTDVDWFRFRTNQTGTANDSVRIDFSHAAGDLDLFLYAADGTTLLKSSEGVSDSEQVSLQGLASGVDYYVKVASYNGASNPAYKLTFRTPSGPTTDSREPNDSQGAATNLGTLQGLSTIANLSIHQSLNEDWFQFQAAAPLEAGNSIGIDFSHAAGDLDLRLYGADGLLRSSTGLTDREVIDLGGLPAGVYYVKVYGYNGAVNPNYSLSFNLPSGAAGDRYEANDTSPTARDLGQVRGRLDQAHGAGLSIHTATDHDWFRFETVAPGSTGHYARIDFLNSLGDLDLFLYGSNGTTLLRSSTSTSDAERIDLAGLGAGVYYLEVIGYNGATNNDYALSIEAPSGSSLSADRLETNNSSGTATLLRSGTANTLSGSRREEGLTITAGDEDWFQFTTVATGTQASAASIQFLNANGNLDLRLYSSNGTTLLRQAASLGDGETLPLDGLAAGTYYLRVLGVTAGTANGYGLSIVTPASSPSTGNTWTVLFYVTASNLERWAAQKINQLEALAAELPGSVHLAVLYDQNSAQAPDPFNPSQLRGPDFYPTGNGSQAAWGDTRQAFIQADRNTAPFYDLGQNKIVTTFQPLTPAGERNTGDPAVLTSFIQWAVQNAPAEHYALVLQDHGGGFYGINYDFDGIGSAPLWSERLSVPELATALQNAGTHFDLVAADACLMGMSEVAFALRDWTDVFMGGQEVLLTNSYNYYDDFAILKSNPGQLTAEQLATSIISAFDRNVFASSNSQARNGKHTTLAAIDTSALPALANALQAFTAAVASHATNNDWQILGQARARADTFDLPLPSEVDAQADRDLANFAGYLAGQATLTPAIRSAAQALYDAVLAAVFSRSDPEFRIRPAQGLSIYLPAPNTPLASDYTTSAAAFLQAVPGWTDFLARVRANAAAVTGGVGIGGTSGQAYDDSTDWAEVNDTASDAFPLGHLTRANNLFDGLSLSEYASAGTADEDWFRFTTETAGTAADSVHAFYAAATGFLRLGLYSAANPNTPLGTSVNGSGDDSLSLAGLPAGDYLLRIQHQGAAPFLPYRLKIDAPSVTTPAPDWAAGNTSIDKAFAVGAITTETVLSGLSVAAGVEDWLAFDTPVTIRDQTGVLHVRRAGTGTETLTVALFDANGNFLRSQSSTDEVHLEYTFGSNQSYRLRVQTTGPGVSVYSVRFEPGSRVRGAVPFADTFQRSDQPLLGSPWTERQGDFQVQGQTVRAGATTSLATLNGVSIADVSLDADLSVASPGQAAGLVARYSGFGDRDMYWGGLANIGGQVMAEIRRNLGGVWTTLAASPVGSATGHVLFQVVGSNLSLGVNGQWLTTASDGNLAATGAVALRGQGGRFDNVGVNAYSPPVQPPEPEPTPVPKQLLTGDVTTRVQVVPGASRRIKKFRVVQFLLRNTSSERIGGPIKLAFGGVPKGTKVTGKRVKTITLTALVLTAGLEPGQEAAVSVTFKPSRGQKKVKFSSIRVLAGS